MSLLKNAYKINITGCNITDVSMLGDVTVLNLTNCKYITDVSMLSNVRYLNISGCHNIEDLSMLGDIYDFIYDDYDDDDDDGTCLYIDDY